MRSCIGRHTILAEFRETNMMRLLVTLAAVSGSVHTAAAASLPLACDTESELVRNLDFVRDVCAQTGESFADSYTRVPNTCASPTCKVAVERAARDCGPLLASSPWFKTWDEGLHAAQAKCAPTAPPPTMHAVATPPSRIVSCSGVLSDGAGEYGSGWNRAATLDATPMGGKVRLNFTSLVLAEGDWVKVFDGPDEDAPVLQQLRMKALPAAAFVSSGRFLHVQMVTNDAGVASGFSAAVSCVCADAPAWHDFETGNGCHAYQPTANGSLFSNCEESAQAAPAEGQTDTGVTLTAKEACPRACQACGPCESSPCKHNGTCIGLAPSDAATATAAVKGTQQQPPGGHRRRRLALRRRTRQLQSTSVDKCPPAEINTRTLDVNAQCCGADDTTCKNGAPTSCDGKSVYSPVPCSHVLGTDVVTAIDSWCGCLFIPVAGCASVFLPFWRDCQTALATQSATLLPVVSLCEARAAGYQCSCGEGWGGAHCEEPRSCEAHPCGAHGTCVTLMGSYRCQCRAGWQGATCEEPPSRVGFEKVASHIVNVTAAGLTFIEDALPKGAGLQACVPAALRFIYLCARICV